MHAFKKIMALLMLAGMLSAQTGGPVSPRTQADITGAAATVAVAVSGGARWIQITAPATNSASVRWGDANTSATRGGIIAPGGAQFIPSLYGGDFYPLASLYVYAALNDKVTVTWAN